MAEVLPPDKVLSRAWEHAEALSSKPTLLLRYTRLILRNIEAEMQYLLGYGLAMEGLALMEHRSTEINDPAQMDISGKTAIVTGAASGIGLGIATALAEAGANVVMADIQKDAVEQAAHGLSGTNKRVMPVRIDVTQEQSVLDALAEAERNFGKFTSPATMPACRCTARK